MKADLVIIEKKEPGIAWVQVNNLRGGVNVLDTATLKAMNQAFDSLSKDLDVRVVVLTGAGEKSFIAGADIAEMKDKNHGSGTDFARLGQEVTKKIEYFPHPVIAAVNGYALGGGTEMAIACDFILASDTAVFGQPEVALGIIPGFGATSRLARYVGWPRAKELIFTGRRFKAEEAKRLGIALEVYPQEEFASRVLAVAKSIALNSVNAVAHTKKLMVEFNETAGLSYKLDAEAQDFGRLFGTFDQKEGMAAFVEKRKAAFKGLK